MVFERGRDIGVDERGNEVEDFLRDEEELGADEWSFIKDEGEKEILNTFKKEGIIHHTQLKNKIEDFKNFLEEYPELENLDTVQKAKLSKTYS